MMKVIVNGANGAMGRELCRLLSEGDRLAARVDISGGDGVHRDFSNISTNADVVVDFSFHTATAAAVDYALARRIPLVVGTTGHTEEERAYILKAAKTIPVFYTGNMSLGVAVLCKLTALAAAAFPDADIEILETHHNRKADAPSGTALMLAEAAASQRETASVIAGRRGKRQKEEIGISSLRLGNTVGIHEVMISTGTETITLKHEAHDRALFARGALEAAAFLVGKAPGHYEMADLVG